MKRGDYERMLPVALAAARAVDETAEIANTGRGIRLFYRRDFWTEARRRASSGCRAGRYDHTFAGTLQEQANRKHKGPLKRAIREECAAAGVPVPERITAHNRYHHDKIVEVSGGYADNLDRGRTPAEAVAGILASLRQAATDDERPLHRQAAAIRMSPPAYGDAINGRAKTSPRLGTVCAIAAGLGYDLTLTRRP